MGDEDGPTTAVPASSAISSSVQNMGVENSVGRESGAKLTVRGLVPGVDCKARTQVPFPLAIGLCALPHHAKDQASPALVELAFLPSIGTEETRQRRRAS